MLGQRQIGLGMQPYLGRGIGCMVTSSRPDGTMRSGVETAVQGGHGATWAANSGRISGTTHQTGSEEGGSNVWYSRRSSSHTPANAIGRFTFVRQALVSVS